MTCSRFLARLSLTVACLLCHTLTAAAATVTLAWDANPEQDVRGYVLRYGTQPGVYTTEIDVGNRTTHTVELTEPGTRTYYFVVQAYNDSLRSANSAEVSATVINAVSQPALTIDRPATGAVIPTDLVVSGWAADFGAPDGTGVNAIHIYAHPVGGGAPIFLGVAHYGASRGDVGAVFGAQFTNSGYSLTAVGLPPGDYYVGVYARSTVANAFNSVRTQRVSVLPGLVATGPTIVIDAPAQNSSTLNQITIQGWATDMQSTSGTGIDELHLWAYPSPGSGAAPVFAGVATYGVARDDVGAAFGSQHRYSGFSATVSGLPEGIYDIAIFAVRRGVGDLGRARVVRVSFANPVLVAIDTPVHGVTLPAAPFIIGGWALDLRAVTDTGVDAVHVWMYPNPGSGAAAVFLGSATRRTRADVAAVFGPQFKSSGYDLLVPALRSGTYDIVVFARSSVSGTFAKNRVIRVAVE